MCLGSTNMKTSTTPCLRLPVARFALSGKAVKAAPMTRARAAAIGRVEARQSAYLSCCSRPLSTTLGAYCQCSNDEEEL